MSGAPKNNANRKTHGLYGRLLRSKSQRLDHKNLLAMIQDDQGRLMLEDDASLTKALLLDFIRNNPDPAKWSEAEREAWTRQNAEVRRNIEALARVIESQRENNPVDQTINIISPDHLSAPTILTVRGPDGTEARLMRMGEQHYLQAGNDWRLARRSTLDDVPIWVYVDAVALPAGDPDAG